MDFTRYLPESVLCAVLVGPAASRAAEVNCGVTKKASVVVLRVHVGNIRAELSHQMENSCRVLVCVVGK